MSYFARVSLLSQGALAPRSQSAGHAIRESEIQNVAWQGAIVAVAWLDESQTSLMASML
jgi:hypothetical protein